MRQLRIENYLILHSSFFTSLNHLSPFTAHRLVDKQVGSIVAYEELRLGVEMQGAIQTQGADTHIDDGGTVMTIGLVQGELTAVANTLQEVGVARLGIGQLVDNLLHIGAQLS